jgi:hypothetical protein
MKAAPFSIFLRSLKSCGITSLSWRLWLVTTAPSKKLVRAAGGAPGTVPAFMSAYMRSNPTESMSKIGAATPR